ncbi:MAG TPA: hypothetical protein VGD67_12105 [Pseudonocardiaceae bacterium]
MNEVQIRITGTDRTGPAFAGATKNIRDLGIEGAKAGDVVAGSMQRMADRVEAAQLKLRKATDAQADQWDRVRAAQAAVDHETMQDVVNTRRLETAKARLESQLRKMTQANDAVAASTRRLADAQKELEAAGTSAGEALSQGVALGAARAAGATAPKLVQALGASQVIVPAMTALGHVAAGALVAGFGVGIAALGVAVAAQNQQVEDSFGALSDYVSTRAQRISAPFEPELKKIAAQGAATWASLEGDLSQALTRMAPATSRFTGQVGKALAALGPAFDPLARGAVAVLDDVGDRLPRIIGGLSRQLAALGDAVADSPEAFGRMVEALGVAVRLVLALLTGFIKVNSAAGDFVQKLMSPLELLLGEDVANFLAPWGGFKDDVAAATPEVDKLTTSLDSTAQAQQRAAAAAEEHAKALADLADDARTLAGADLELRESLAELPQLQKAAAEAVRDHGKESAEAADASRALERGYLNAYDAVVALSEAQNQALPQNQRTVQAHLDATESILGMALAAGKDAPPELQRLAASFADANRSAIDATVATGDFNTAVVTLPGGRTVTIAVDDQGSPVIQSVQDKLEALNNKVYQAKLRIITEGRIPTGVWAGAGGAMASMAHGGISGAAGGGPRSRQTLVGENGPEVVDLPPGSMVHPAGTSRTMLGEMAAAAAAPALPPMAEWRPSGDRLSDAVLEWLIEEVRRRGGLGRVFVA